MPTNCGVAYESVPHLLEVTWFECGRQGGGDWVSLHLPLSMNLFYVILLQETLLNYVISHLRSLTWRSCNNMPKTDIKTILWCVYYIHYPYSLILVYTIIYWQRIGINSRYALVPCHFVTEAHYLGKTIEARVREWGHDFGSSNWSKSVSLAWKSELWFECHCQWATSDMRPQIRFPYLVCPSP